MKEPKLNYINGPQPQTACSTRTSSDSSLIMDEYQLPVNPDNQGLHEWHKNVA